MSCEKVERAKKQLESQIFKKCLSEKRDNQEETREWTMSGDLFLNFLSYLFLDRNEEIEAAGKTPKKHR